MHRIKKEIHLFTLFCTINCSSFGKRVFERINTRETLKILIGYGSKVNILNKDGKTPADMVRDSQYDKFTGINQVRELLQKAECDIGQTESMIDSLERLSIDGKDDCEQEKSSNLLKRSASSELQDYPVSKLTRSTFLEK